MTPTATPIGQTLLQLGLISKDQLHIALREQGRSGEILGRQLVRLGFLSETTLRDALARSLGRPSADLSRLLPDAATSRRTIPTPSGEQRWLQNHPMQTRRRPKRRSCPLPHPRQDASCS